MQKESFADPETGVVQSKVLVVDDDEVTRIYLEHALQAQGYRVSVADSFDAVKSSMQSEAYALVLMDLVFVDCNYSGFDILEYVRSVNDSCGIVIMTSYPCTDSAVQALRIKASDYLTKPVKTTELIATVQKVMKEQALTAVSDAGLSAAEELALSSREMEVLQMLFKGYSYTEIAVILDCGTSTAKTYGKRVYKKLGVQSRSEAVYEALHLKLIQR